MECQTGAIGLNEDIQDGFLIFRMSSWNFNFLSASPAKRSSLSSSLFLLCYEPKLNFGQTEVADRDRKSKIHRSCEARYVPHGISFPCKF